MRRLLVFRPKKLSNLNVGLAGSGIGPMGGEQCNLKIEQWSLIVWRLCECVNERIEPGFAYLLGIVTTGMEQHL